MSSDLVYLSASIFVVLAALTLTPAQLAARYVLRQISGAAARPRKHKAVVIGIGIGAIAAICLTASLVDARAPLFVAILTLLVLLAVVDLAWRWLPLEWCALLGGLGLTDAMLTDRLPDAALGALIGAGLLSVLRASYLYFRQIEAIGLGDIWLSAAIGTLVGAQQVFLLLGVAACLGLLLHFASIRTTKVRYGVAFGAHLSAATVIFLRF